MSTPTSTKLALAFGCFLLLLSARMILPTLTQPVISVSQDTRVTSFDSILVGGLMLVLVMAGVVMPLVVITLGRRPWKQTPPEGNKIIEFPMRSLPPRAEARLPVREEQLGQTWVSRM